MEYLSSTSHDLAFRRDRAMRDPDEERKRGEHIIVAKFLGNSTLFEHQRWSRVLMKREE